MAKYINADALREIWVWGKNDKYGYSECIPLKDLESLPSVHLEPLTDAEQRIFLAAMGREEKICEEADRNYVREPYKNNLMSDKDNLMSICREIRRKVKGALWT